MKSSAPKQQSAGYSGTPLYKKLGLKEGFTICIVNAPENYFELLKDIPDNIRVQNDAHIKKDLIHYFTKSAEALYNDMLLLKSQIATNGSIWISWPKKSSKVPTDITEDIIRELACVMD